MTINDIKELLGAEVLCGSERLDMEVHSACGSDMMSDVLAYVKNQDGASLEKMAKVFEDMLELARESGIAVLTTPLRMYEACGKLYMSGLKGNGETND